MPAYRIVSIEPHPLDELAQNLKHGSHTRMFFQSRIRKENSRSSFARCDIWASMKLKNSLPLSANIEPASTGRGEKLDQRSKQIANAWLKLPGTHYTHSRFHRDSLIPNVVADKIKANWTAGFFDGTRGNDLLLASVNGRISGYLLLIEREDKLTIDLIAVDKLERGRGLAKALVEHAMECAPNHIKLMSAGTQRVTVIPYHFMKLWFQQDDASIDVSQAWTCS